MSAIPEGFVLDTAPPTGGGALPPGFVIDASPTSTGTVGGFSVGGGGGQATPAPQPAAPPEKMSLGRDIVRSIGTGLVKGGAGIASTLSSPVDSALYGLGWLATHGLEAAGVMPKGSADVAMSNPPSTNPGSGIDGLAPAVMAAAGGEHKPQTYAGQAAETVSSFLPGAAATASKLSEVPAALVKYGVLPGAASEAAGRYTEGTGLEPLARMAGGFAGGLPGMAMDWRNAAPKAAVGGALKQMSDAETAQAGDLIRGGSTLPEAVAKATGGRVDLTDMQRVLEKSDGGQPVFSGFMSQRPEQNRAMAQQTFDGVSPPSATPFEVAPRVQAAAKGEVDAARDAINAAAKPHYDAARNTLIPAADFATLQANPAFAAALKDVRSHEILGPTVAGLPDNAVGVLDAVKKRLGDMYEQAADATKPQRFLASEIDNGTRATRDAATAASPDYAEALRIGAEGRQNVLGPMERAPIGQLADAEKFPEQAAIIFNPKPLPGSELQVGSAVAQIARKDPEAARNFVRMKLEQAFNDASSNNAFADQRTGATFARNLLKDPQEARNLEAAVRGLPGGDQIWSGMSKMFDIFEAQGYRQGAGSQTTNNTRIQENLKGGGGILQDAATAASPSKLASFVSDLYDQFKYGKNTEFWSKLFTNPDAVAEMQRLRIYPSNSPKALERASALVARSFSQEDQEQQRSIPGR